MDRGSDRGGRPFLATLNAESRIIANAPTFQTDAMIHEIWMRGFQAVALTVSRSDRGCLSGFGFWLEDAAHYWRSASASGRSSPSPPRPGGPGEGGDRGRRGRDSGRRRRTIAGLGGRVCGRRSRPRGNRLQECEPYGYPRTLPKETMRRRPFGLIRERMFAIVRAYYGPSVEAAIQLRDRYGADYMLVRRGASKRPWPSTEPFASEVRCLRGSVAVPAVDQLPELCALWRSGSLALYDLACVARDERR